MAAAPIRQVGFYKGRSILVPQIPKIAPRCRLSTRKLKLEFSEFSLKNLVKMKGVMRYVA